MAAALVPVILCGGAGTRLWPLSTDARPKQFLRLLGPETLFQMTLRRTAALPGAQAPIVVANLRHREPALGQASAAGLALGRIVLEPFGRNTAAAVASAALASPDPRAVLLVAPSDHRIADEAAFARAVAVARSAAEDGRLVTFGVRPSGPETGYGYIRRGASIGDGIYEIAAFVEKPDADRAAAMLAQGGHFWNAGLFVFRADALLDEMRRRCPALLAAAADAVAQGRPDGDALELDASAFARAESLPIDVAVMEKTALGAMVPTDMAWSDLGSWSSVYDALPKDARGNAVLGEARLEDCAGCLVFAETRPLGLVGLRGVAAIECADGVAIVPLDRSQDVKKLAAPAAAR